MIEKHFEDIVLKHLGFDFSGSQKKAMDKFISFFFGREENSIFLLKGYAGTGKTSLVAAIVQALQKFQYNVVLLAPTGRAAKVFSSYAGVPAYTIHKKIYRQKSVTNGEGDFNLGFNGGNNILFFVDEASMISNFGEENGFGSGRLLDDLIEYVYNGRNNRLVLIGDKAQLPPVGLNMSPALDINYLRSSYFMEIYESDLTDVVRQAETSGILYNATAIRRLIGNNKSNLKMKLSGFPDIFRIRGDELLEQMESCYSQYGVDETIVICRSNKRANRYNQGIRGTILYREEDFCTGDRVMVVKNNYFWGKDYEKIDFIANGDIATVIRTGRRMELYGFNFVKTDLLFSGYDEEVSALVLLDTLNSDYPALNQEQNIQLYRNIEEDFYDVNSKRKRYEKIRDNEYFNALQIKFAYAVTCHKAQGGQWDAVFIDNGGIMQDTLNDDYWKWLYTAITRARQKVYFINFPDKFFLPQDREE